MSIFFCFNDRFYKEGRHVITPDNRGLKYGDGLFETIKMVRGKLLLKEYHFERLFKGMQALSFLVPSSFDADFLEKKITELAKKNTHVNTTKVRVMVFRGDGNLSETQNNFPNYILQTWELPEHNTLNTDGLVIDVFPHAKKACDQLANIKSNNFLAYSLAAMYAKSNGLDDCILLNTNGTIADTTVANIFIIKDKMIFTPLLQDGCIAGTMRRWILKILNDNSNAVIEGSLSVNDIKEADEVFVTNSIHPVRWVKQFADVKYDNAQVRIIYDALNKTF